MRISQIKNQNVAAQRELHKLTNIAEIQEQQLDHLDLKIMANEKLTLKELRYNPAMLISAANPLVFQTMDIARIISATVKQAQMSRLSTDLLKGRPSTKYLTYLTKQPRKWYATANQEICGSVSN